MSAKRASVNAASGDVTTIESGLKPSADADMKCFINTTRPLKFSNERISTRMVQNIGLYTLVVDICLDISSLVNLTATLKCKSSCDVHNATVEETFINIQRQPTKSVILHVTS